MDDDCDGVVDESLPVVLGTACPTNTPNCDALGVWTCGPGEVPVCVTDPTLCAGSDSVDPTTSTPADEVGGGTFTTTTTKTESQERVTSTCASGPNPGPGWLLLIAWLVCRARWREPRVS